MPLPLRSLSDDIILSRIRDLVRRERNVTIAVLDHLNEIRRRELHLKLGYSCMFTYCTKALGYSSSAAGRRIQTAVCLARYPEVRGLLESGEANLCTIAMVSRILTPRNRDEILGRIRGKSQSEVSAIVVEYDPLSRQPRDRVTPVAVAAVAPHTTALPLLTPHAASPSPRQDGEGSTMSASVAPEPSSTSVACEKENYSRSGSASPIERSASPEGIGGMAHENEGAVEPTRTYSRFRIQFAASEAFMKQLERFRALASHRLPANASLEQVFALALGYFIEREDASKRHERRERRKEKQRATAERSVPRPQRQWTACATPEDPRPQRQCPPNRRRAIPSPARDAVFVRDQGRCTFVGSNGTRCESTRALQIDHIKSVALGGVNTPDNLRLLCAYHNRFEAERLLGP